MYIVMFICLLYIVTLEMTCIITIIIIYIYNLILILLKLILYTKFYHCHDDVYRSLACIRHYNYYSIYIIESVDSISRDERDVPLTQYITNA